MTVMTMKMCLQIFSNRKQKLTNGFTCSALKSIVSKTTPLKIFSQPIIWCHRKTKANPLLGDPRLL